MALSLDQRKFILDSHPGKESEEEPNASEVVRQCREKFGVSLYPAVVNDIWKRNGLPVRKRGGRTSGLSDEEMRDYCYESNGNYKLAAAKHGGTPGKYLSRWKDLGLLKKVGRGYELA